MVLVIPRIPHDPNSDAQELLRTRLTETLSSHYKIIIIDQYDGDDDTSTQRRRAWQADEPSYYGHPSSPPQQPTFTEAAQLDMCSAFCFRTRLLSIAYETERIAAVGQGSYLYQNDTGLPDGLELLESAGFWVDSGLSLPARAGYGARTDVMR